MPLQSSVKRDNVEPVPIINSAVDVVRQSGFTERQAPKPPNGHSSRREALTAIALLGDVLVLLVSSLAASHIMLDEINSFRTTMLALLAVGSYTALCASGGTYSIEAIGQPTLNGEMAVPIWIACSVLFIVVLYADGAIGGAVLWKFAPLWMALSALSLLAFRASLRRFVRFVRRAGWLRTRVVVIGRGPSARPTASALAAAQGDGEIAIVEFIELPSSDIDAVALGSRLQSLAPEAVVLLTNWADREAVLATCEAARTLPVDVLLTASAMPPGAGLVVNLAGQRFTVLWLRPLGSWRGIVKRIEDLVIGSVATLAGLPVILLVAICVWIDSRGPILIRQRRFGFGNQPIQVWKFRTMHWDPAELSGARPAVRNDPRVTRVGRVLRSTSLDELPQLFNVLFGDMSLVGPRPHPVEMRVGHAYYHDVVYQYAARHRVKPGITGLAQINGCRGLVDTLEKAQRRLDYDLHYVQNWSFALDVSILVKTAYKGFINTASW